MAGPRKTGLPEWQPEVHKILQTPSPTNIHHPKLGEMLQEFIHHIGHEVAGKGYRYVGTMPDEHIGIEWAEASAQPFAVTFKMTLFEDMLLGPQYETSKKIVEVVRSNMRARPHLRWTTAYVDQFASVASLSKDAIFVIKVPTAPITRAELLLVKDELRAIITYLDAPIVSYPAQKLPASVVEFIRGRNVIVGEILKKLGGKSDAEIGQILGFNPCEQFGPHLDSAEPYKQHQLVGHFPELENQNWKQLYCCDWKPPEPLSFDQKAWPKDIDPEEKAPIMVNGQIVGVVKNFKVVENPEDVKPQWVIGKGLTQETITKLGIDVPKDATFVGVDMGVEGGDKTAVTIIVPDDEAESIEGEDLVELTLSGLTKEEADQVQKTYGKQKQKAVVVHKTTRKEIGSKSKAVVIWPFESDSMQVNGEPIMYKAQLNEDGSISCNCMGWCMGSAKSGTGRRCKHTDAIKVEAEVIYKKWKKGEPLGENFEVVSSAAAEASSKTLSKVLKEKMAEGDAGVFKAKRIVEI